MMPGNDLNRRFRRLEPLAALAALFVVAVLTLHRLGSGPCDAPSHGRVVRWLDSKFCGADVCGGNEAIEGVFVQQMVEHGGGLFPLENGRQPMYKPPLFHWTALGIDRLLGLTRVTAFNLRIPSALYTIAATALTIAFAWSRFGPPAAISAGLVLAGSYQYIGLGRVGRVDMALTFFEALALFAFLWWMPAKTDSPPPANRGGAKFRYLFAMALGAAVLAKGPVGALLPMLAIGIFLMIERRFAQAFRAFVPGPAIIATVIASSWYAACLIGRRYGFLNRQLGFENFGRFFGTLGAMPPWYYLKPLFLNSAPLSLLAPVAVGAALTVARPEGAEGGGAQAMAARQRDAVRLLAIFWIVTVVFFSIAAYKRRSYLLPLWPPAAVVLGWWLEAVAARGRWGRWLRESVALVCAALILFNFLYLPWRELHDCGDESYRPAALAINRAVGPREPLYAFGFREDLAPLLFYLRRNVTPIHGRLGDAPPGYVIVPGQVWASNRDRAPGLAPVLTAPHGRFGLVLLSHGRFYAHLQ